MLYPPGLSKMVHFKSPARSTQTEIRRVPYDINKVPCRSASERDERTNVRYGSQVAVALLPYAAAVLHPSREMAIERLPVRSTRLTISSRLRRARSSEARTPNC